MREPIRRILFFLLRQGPRVGLQPLGLGLPIREDRTMKQVLFENPDELIAALERRKWFVQIVPLQGQPIEVVRWQPPDNPQPTPRADHSVLFGLECRKALEP